MVTQLRSTLTEIAKSGNDRIQQILSEKKPIADKLTEVQDVIREKNEAADTAGQAALDAIAKAAEKMFHETGIGGDARQWLKEHGAKFDSPPRKSPLTAEELERKTSVDGGGGAPAADPQRQAPLTAHHIGIAERHLDMPHRRRHHRPLRQAQRAQFAGNWSLSR